MWPVSLTVMFDFTISDLTDCRSIHVNLHNLHGRVPSVQTPEASFNEALPAARALWIGLPAGPSRDAVTGCRCGDDTRVFCGCFGDCRSKTFQNQWHVGDRGGTWRYPVPRRYHLDQGSKT